MNNLFLRLYLLIVATVIIVGISLDYAWQHFEQKETPNEHNQTLLRLVSLQLDELKENKLKHHLQQLNSQFKGEFSLLLTNHHLAQSIQHELQTREPILLQSDAEILGFIKLAKHPQILQLKFLKQDETSPAKNIFIGLFYGLIALVIFYWIWPLSKDLNQLEKAVNQFDQQQWQSKVELPATSSINHLAKAYNALLDKIKLLVETQQAMSHSISHELRTPLARIRFSLQMAKESDDISGIRTQIASISEDISEMNELINELLNFASLESISAVAKLEKGDINMLIETLVERLTKNHPDKKIKFMQNSPNTNVSCDSYLMERAIQNLIVNACKFSNKSILITFAQSVQYYQILVEDDGPGIAKKSRDKIFDSFVQLKNQHKNKGFGLGLAIVKRVMMLHGGSAKIERSSLGGAKFILSWPK